MGTILHVFLWLHETCLRQTIFPSLNNTFTFSFLFDSSNCAWVLCYYFKSLSFFLCHHFCYSLRYNLSLPFTALIMTLMMWFLFYYRPTCEYTPSPIHTRTPLVHLWRDQILNRNGWNCLFLTKHHSYQTGTGYRSARWTKVTKLPDVTNSVSNWIWQCNKCFLGWKLVGFCISEMVQPNKVIDRLVWTKTWETRGERKTVCMLNSKHPGRFCDILPRFIEQLQNFQTSVLRKVQWNGLPLSTFWLVNQIRLIPFHCFEQVTFSWEFGNGGWGAIALLSLANVWKNADDKV